MSEKHGPNGFLMGLILGGAVGALISTKRGRQILKDIADYGLEYVGNTINFEDFEAILDEDEEEMMKGEMETASKSQPTANGVEKMPQEVVRPVEHVQVHRPQPKPEAPKRRLFRGLRRK